MAVYYFYCIYYIYSIYNLLRGSEKSVGLGEGVGFADVDEVEVVAAESFDANRAGLGYGDIAGVGYVDIGGL